MPAMLPAIAAIGGLVGAGVSAVGALKQGEAEQNAANYNAQIAEQSASTIRENAVLNEYRARKVMEANTGTQIGAYSRAGVSTTTGSPLDVYADDIANAELEMSINKYNSDIEAQNAQSQAKMLRYQGEQAKKLSYYKATSTLLTSGTDSVFKLSKEKIGKNRIGE